MNSFLGLRTMCIHCNHWVWVWQKKCGYCKIEKQEKGFEKGFSFGELVFFVLIIFFSAIVLVGVPYSHQADQITEQKCSTTGYFQKERLFIELQQKNLEAERDKNFCYARLALEKYGYDKNKAQFSRIIETVFYTEKLWRDYNSFAFDLNACARFC